LIDPKVSWDNKPGLAPLNQASAAFE